jgi:hypothetical protein
MKIDSILSEHPSLKEAQVIKIINESDNETTQFNSACPYLIWVGDQGNVAIMRASRDITVRVDHIRNGQWNGAVYVAMKKNDTIEIRHNDDGQNYDSFSC